MLNTAFAARTNEPFPHFQVQDLLREGDAARLLVWFQADAPWKLVVEEFYEQYEFSLLSAPLPSDVEFLISPRFVAKVAYLLRDGFVEESELELTEIAAHRLTDGQTIRVHNDFIGDEETHRFLVQINAGWEAKQGGLLMLFNSRHPEDIAELVLPSHNSGFGFEISPNSFHAVSTIYGGQRFTLVYTFKRRP